MTKRTPKETWGAIERQAESDEIERFLAKSRDEVDASLRSQGHDPSVVRAQGVALAKKLGADRERLAWQVEAAQALAKEQARFDGQRSRYAGVPKDELEKLIAVARTNPRLAQPVAVLFRNRKPGEASEDELRAILEEIDALAEDRE